MALKDLSEVDLRAWQKVRDESVAREGQVLDDDMIRKIVKTAKAKDADGDFAMVVMLMAATGARFSQLARMR